MIVGLAACLTPWASPPVALAVGMVLALTLGNPFRARSGKVAKLMLQASVVLLGFGMNLPAVLRVGGDGALFASITIATTFGLGYSLGRLLHIDSMATTLISSGTAICGGSAIAAVGAAVDADDSQMTVSMGTVFLLNAVALYIFPIIGHSLHLTQGQFGTWAGIAIHDVSSVVGAAAGYGNDSLQIATAVKLSRTLWIVPVTFVIAWIVGRARKKDTAADSEANRPIEATLPHKKLSRRLPIPLFILLFLVASMMRSFVPGVPSAAPYLTTIAKVGLTATLFLIGSNLSRATLKSVGPRAMILGVALWCFIGTASLTVILLLH